MVFIIQGIKQSIPIVVKSCPKVTIKSYWLTAFSGYLLMVLVSQAVISDNHSCNVSAFSKLKKTDCPYFLDLSCGKLTVPSAPLTELVYQSFALLDLHDSSIHSQYYLCTCQAVLCMLKYYLDNIEIFCDDHFSKGLKILLY